MCHVWDSVVVPSPGFVFVFCGSFKDVEKMLLLFAGVLRESYNFLCYLLGF